MAWRWGEAGGTRSAGLCGDGYGESRSGQGKILGH